MSGFQQRGVIEGFYGTPWTHEDRLWLIERLGAWGMNAYVYAPKDDPLHRERWREPYPTQAVGQFRELVTCGLEHGVRVGFAVSPGRSIRYAAAEERGLLAQKFAVFQELGSRLLVLALDDVPSSLVHAEDARVFPTLAQAHTALVHELREVLGGESELALIPTDYLGTEPTEYLEELGERLDPAIHVGWTGRTVIRPSALSAR